MSVAFDLEASNLLSKLERAEKSRSDRKLNAIRPELAEKIGIPAGTAENIRRGRSKGVRQWVAAKIRKAFVRELADQMMRLSGDLQLVFQSGARPNSDEVVALQTALAALRKLIEEAK